MSQAMMITSPQERCRLICSLAVAVICINGCGVDVPGGGNPGPSTADNSHENEPPLQPVLSDKAVPDFALIDVNLNSPRHGETVTPRDYLGRVSAWYFGHST